MSEIKKILMERDGLSETEAEDRISDAEDELNELLADPSATLADAEMIVRDHFGLEPDYLMEILPI